MYPKDHFLKYTFYPPDDIRFEIYSNKIWNYFLSQADDINLKVIDVGCGGGTALHVLEKLGYKNLEGIDIFDIVPKGFIKNFKFYHENFLNSSLIANSYDVVISAMVLEHVEENKFVDEVYRILRPGGIALITTVLKNRFAWYWYKHPSGETLLHPDHVKEYKSIDEFEEIFKGKFEILKTGKALIKYPIIDPPLKLLIQINSLKYIRNIITTHKFLKKLRLIRVPVPNYYAAETVVKKIA